MTYEELLIESDNNNLIAKEKPLKANNGRIKGNRIAIRKNMTVTEKKCVLAEELGHYHTAIGDILDQSDTTKRKLEQRGRIMAYNKLIGLRGILNAHIRGCHSLHESAEYLEVTEEFLQEAICYYKSKYGKCAVIDNYAIVFDPAIAVIELL